MSRVLYIACAAYSGSTFLSFLLNTHPCVVTVGHSTGWSFGPDEEFICSCGERLQDCPFFGQIAEDFRAADLTFDPADFGNAYRVAPGDRPNRWLTGNLSRLEHSGLERLRDRLVWALPSWRRKLSRQDRANEVFIHSALQHSGASVFVDNSHDPHRLRHLRRVDSLELQAIHLVRDLRGVALSNRMKKGWDVAMSTLMWLRKQSMIARVTAEWAETRRVYYEALCADVDGSLREIHNFMGLDFQPFGGDFKAGEHHILGNVMRLREGRVSVDTRWQTELSGAELAVIADTARRWVDRRRDQTVGEMVEYYLAGDGFSG